MEILLSHVRKTRSINLVKTESTNSRLKVVDYFIIQRFHLRNKNFFRYFSRLHRCPFIVQFFG